MFGVDVAGQCTVSSRLRLELPSAAAVHNTSSARPSTTCFVIRSAGSLGSSRRLPGCPFELLSEVDLGDAGGPRATLPNGGCGHTSWKYGANAPRCRRSDRRRRRAAVGAAAVAPGTLFPPGAPPQPPSLPSPPARRGAADSLVGAFDFRRCAAAGAVDAGGALQLMKYDCSRRRARRSHWRRRPTRAAPRRRRARMRARRSTATRRRNGSTVTLCDRCASTAAPRSASGRRSSVW